MDTEIKYWEHLPVLEYSNHKDDTEGRAEVEILKVKASCCVSTFIVEIRFYNGTMAIRTPVARIETEIDNTKTILFAICSCAVAFILLLVILVCLRRKFGIKIWLKWIDIWDPTKRSNANNKKQTLPKTKYNVEKASSSSSYEKQHFGVNKSTNAQYFPN